MRSILNLRKSEAPGPTVEELRAACEECSSLLKWGGLPVEPFRDPALPHLMELSHSMRQRVLRDLENFTTALRDLATAGIDFKDSRALLDRALHRFAFKADADFFDYIQDGDIVEIYNLKNQQIFRNAFFFGFADVTVAQVIYAEWPKISKRDMKLTFNLFKHVALLATGMISKTRPLDDIPEHQVDITIDSKPPFLLKFRAVTPVRQNGKTMGYLVCHRCRYPETDSATTP